VQFDRGWVSVFAKSGKAVLEAVRVMLYTVQQDTPALD